MKRSLHSLTSHTSTCCADSPFLRGLAEKEPRIFEQSRSTCGTEAPLSSCATQRRSIGVRCDAHCCHVSSSASVLLAASRTSEETGERSCISSHSSCSPYHRRSLRVAFAGDWMAAMEKPRRSESVCGV
eukprot:4577463-Pleurochrysis_carterae.AAC.2